MPPDEALKWYVTSAVPPRSLILAVVGAPTRAERSALNLSLLLFSPWSKSTRKPTGLFRGRTSTRASPCHPALKPSPLASAWKSPRGTVRLPPTPNWTRAPCPAAVLAANREAKIRPHAALVPLDIRTSSVGQHMGDRTCWSVSYRNGGGWNTLGCFCGRAARTAP